MKSDKPDNRPAWAQQLGESAESFAVFVVYRELGPARSLAEAQRLMGNPQKSRKRATGKMGNPQKSRKRATGKRDVSGCMKRWSKRWKWPDRALAWDAMLEGERTAAVVAAVRKEGQKWAARWEGFREDAWQELQDLVVTIKQLAKRPGMRVTTLKRAVASPKNENDGRDTTTTVNPAIDMLRYIHAQTELAQLCFGDLKLTDAEPDEVVAGEVRLVNHPPGTATEDL